MRFEEYYEFVYLNSKLTKEQALEVARDCWNKGKKKHWAVDVANGFDDYCEYIYLNSSAYMSKEQALEYARECWKEELARYDALWDLRFGIESHIKQDEQKGEK